MMGRGRKKSLFFPSQGRVNLSHTEMVSLLTDKSFYIEGFSSSITYNRFLKIQDNEVKVR